MIPMVDLKRQYSRLKSKIDQAVGQALVGHGAPMLAPNLDKFP